MACNTYTGWNIYWIEEWSQFFDRCNWYTFHPIQIEVEDERNMGGIEATVILLGLGFRIRWNYAETEHVTEIIRMAETVRSSEDSP